MLNYYTATWNPSNVTEWLDAFIPEGYELSEKPEHKEERLKEEIEVIKREIAYHSKHGASLTEELAEKEKELAEYKK